MKKITVSTLLGLMMLSAPFVALGKTVAVQKLIGQEVKAQREYKRLYDRQRALLKQGFAPHSQVIQNINRQIYLAAQNREAVRQRIREASKPIIQRVKETARPYIEFAKEKGLEFKKSAERYGQRGLREAQEFKERALEKAGELRAKGAEKYRETERGLRGALFGKQRNAKVRY